MRRCYGPCLERPSAASRSIDVLVGSTLQPTGGWLATCSHAFSFQRGTVTYVLLAPCLLQVSVFDTIKSWGLGPSYSSKVRGLLPWGSPKASRARYGRRVCGALSLQRQSVAISTSEQ